MNRLILTVSCSMIALAVLACAGLACRADEAPQQQTAGSAVPDSLLLDSIAAQLGSARAVFAPAVLKLLRAGADTSFAYRLALDSTVQHDSKYMRINVTGYLRKPDYSSHYNARSVRKSLEFHRENDSLLALCERQYDVPKEVLTAITWVETRHGGYLGKHQVVSVYLCLAMADEPEYILMNKKKLADSFKGTAAERRNLERKIEKRSARKAAWAVDQLRALERMADSSGVQITGLYGSYAGAFGIAQFIPTSFVSWAVDGDGDGRTDLFSLHDALASAGNYLRSNGWNSTKKGQRAAVYHYNNSQAYVDAVLTLAAKVKTGAAAKAGSKSDSSAAGNADREAQPGSQDADSSGRQR